MKPVIFYHANCTDGFGAAFSAWKFFSDDAEYVPISYGEVKSIDDVDLLGNITGRNVYILDFSFPREVMEYIVTVADKTVWLDHHKTAFEMWLPDQPFTDDATFNQTDDKLVIRLDNQRSGAMIAWDFFVGSAFTGYPDLIAHIDDYDRWKFKMEKTKAFNRALRAIKPWSFVQWDNLLNATRTEYNNMVILGQTLLDDHNMRVQNALKAKRAVVIYDGTHLFAGDAVNASPDLSSDLGHELANASGTFGMVYYIGSDCKVKVSLRSNGDYDVSQIAKMLGGGGHKNAAGCEINFKQLISYLGA